jgi:hypothetical protein
MYIRVLFSSLSTRESPETPRRSRPSRRVLSQAASVVVYFRSERGSGEGGGRQGTQPLLGLGTLVALVIIVTLVTLVRDYARSTYYCNYH